MITPLPTPPTRSDPANFSQRADDFMGALPAFATETNATAVAADADATSALQSKIDAAASAAGANASANVTKWVSGTTYQEGAVVWSPANTFSYRRKTAAGSGTTDPSADGTNYTLVSGAGNVQTDLAQTLTNKTLVSPVLGTPSSGNLANCTFPVLNQSTTGNAATATTAGSCTGNAATATTDSQHYGVGQTWGDYTATRSLGTVYTNSTNRPITVNVYCTIASGAYGTVRALINTITFIIGSDASPSGQCLVTGSVVVPPQTNYTITATGGVTLSSWVELR